MKEYLDAAELGKRVGVSEQMILYYRRQGIIKESFKLGKHYRFDENESIANLRKGQDN